MNIFWILYPILGYECTARVAENEEILSWSKSNYVRYLNMGFDAAESIPDIYFHLWWVFFGVCSLFWVLCAAREAENDEILSQTKYNYVRYLTH